MTGYKILTIKLTILTVQQIEWTIEQMIEWQNEQAIDRANNKTNNRTIKDQ